MRSGKAALKQLDRLVGTWRTRGTVLEGEARGCRFSGSDIYRWLPGNAFVQHTWNVRMPDGIHRGIEILGVDRRDGGLFAHAFDADGTLTVSRLAFKRDRLRISGDALGFDGRFDGDGALEGTWSTIDGGTPVMEVRLAPGRRA